MKLSRVSSWGVALAILSTVGCGSSGNSTGGGGAGGAKAGNGGHAGAGLGGKGGAHAGGAAGGGVAGAAGGAAGGGVAGAAGGAAGGGVAGAAGGAAGGKAGAGGGGAGGKAGAGGGGPGGAGGGANGGGPGGAGGTVTTTKTTLVVDFDGSDNNDDPTQDPSPSDTLFATLLQGENIDFDTIIVPVAGATHPNTPTTSQLAGYNTVIWYNGEQAGADKTLSAAQQAIVEAWLDQGHKTMLVFSEQLFWGLGSKVWTTAETNTFLSNYIGADGDAVDTVAVSEMTYNATGATGTPFAGDIFQVIRDTPIFSTADAVNPKTGTDTLVTAMADPDGNGDQAVPIVVGRKQVGAAGTSTVVYVGMPIEDIQMTVSNNTAAQFFHAVLKYAGLK